MSKKASNAVYLAAAKRLFAPCHRQESSQLASKSRAEGAAICAKNITRNTRRRLGKRRKLSSGDMDERES